MKRTHYIVAYDISCPKRLHRVHDYLQGFKTSGQKSCFDCWLTLSELQHVENTLERLIAQDEDRIHIFALDPRLSFEQFGTCESSLEARSDFPAFYLI